MCLTIAVYETEAGLKKQIRDMLESYAFERNLEYDVLWVGTVPEERVREKLLRSVSLALVSLDCPGAREMGGALYAANQDCRICYYRSSACNLAPLLPTRPIQFCLWPPETGGPGDFAVRLESVFADMERSPHYLRLETRSGLHLIPCREILYLMSDLKYVRIIQSDGTEISVYRKLDELVDVLDSHFVRIHKRYFVNRDHVRLFDKAEHLVHLDNGEVLTISDARYDAALAALRQG